MITSYACAVCGEEIETVIDESAGPYQEYTEDCEVCCRPNVLRVWVDLSAGEVRVESTFEE